MTRDVLGAVLIGGRSRRMGRDKALLELGGRTLVDRAAGVLAGVLGRVVLVGHARPGLRADLETVPDRVPDRGPLGGLLTALEHADGNDVFLLACDLPLVGPELVRHVLAQRAAAGSRPANAYLAASPQGVQPLCGLYTASCRAAAAEALRAGRLRIGELAERLDARPVPIRESLPFYRPDLLHNVNRPEDLAALRQADPATIR